MQRWDSFQNQLPTAAPTRLHSELQDIVSKVQIQSNLCVSHPDYKPLELPESAVERFQQLPWELQLKYLSLQLRSFLYGIYYNGSLKAALAPDADATNWALHQNLEHNTFLRVDLGFYKRLHESNSGRGYFSPDWQVLWHESDRSWVVTKDDLTLYVDCDRYLQPTDQAAPVCDSIAIRMPRNLVQIGFYVAVGNAGPQGHHDIVRVYFNLSAEGAVALMGSLSQQLNAIAVPFSFKALYNPLDYGRYNSAILCFKKTHYKIIWSVLKTIYAENQHYFQKQVPLFTKWIAPGLAIAEEPDRKFADMESFGMNRCQIVANGLLEAWQQGDQSPEGRMASIFQHFSLLGIKLQRPYLNANSQDIYMTLVDYENHESCD
ncbi:MAG TPA: hypothetical protein DCE56_23825 [Cyanobacteria bacterium UBA8553]|nr:hypothetical protein [Cyanobacteria bacterium UBA8553]